MTLRAIRLAGFGLLLATILGLWYLIGSDWHDTAVSTVSDFVVWALTAALRNG